MVWDFYPFIKTSLSDWAKGEKIGAGSFMSIYFVLEIVTFLNNFLLLEKRKITKNNQQIDNYTSSILISKSGHYCDYFPLALRVFLESKWKWFLLAGGRIIKYPLKMAGGSGFFGVFSGFREHASFRSCVCWLNSSPLNHNYPSLCIRCKHNLFPKITRDICQRKLWTL